MITDKKNHKKVLEKDNDVTPEDLVTLEGEGTEINIFLSLLSDCRIILSEVPC